MFGSFSAIISFGYPQEMGINKSEQKNNPKVFLVTYLFHCLSVCNGYLRNTKTLNHETLHA